MSDCRPLVSICLPVYNGEQYVREAIKSILAQTFEDFELVISDNASTDRTHDICRDAAERDRRVRYVRADANRGLAWNFNRAFELAEGPYLVWIGHDDVMGKEYIGCCVEALNQDSGAVLAFANASYIDDKGSVIRRVNIENSGSSERPSERLKHILDHRECHPICGLMRTEVLKQTHLHGGYADSDRVLLAEMGLRGRFSLVPEHLYLRRAHAQSVTKSFQHLRERTIIFDPAKAGKLFFPVVLENMALLSAIRRAKLPFGERLRCHQALLRWFWEPPRLSAREDLREGAVSAIEPLHLPEEIPVGRLRAAKRRLFRPWFS